MTKIQVCTFSLNTAQDRSTGYVTEIRMLDRLEAHQSNVKRPKMQGQRKIGGCLPIVTATVVAPI
jgi:hypothetical protein